MTVLKEMDRFFWIFMVLGVLCGVLFPDALSVGEGYVIYIVMAIMGILFLKVDIFTILNHIKNPFTLLYIIATNLLIIPLLLYGLFFRYLDPNLAMAMLLLSALPSGVSSAAFTDIMKGKTSLGISIIILTNLLAPITIPFLFWLLFKTEISFGNFLLTLTDFDTNLYLFQLPINKLSIYLLGIIIIPFIIAKIIKRVSPIKTLFDKIQDYYDVIILSLLSIMIMISFAFQSTYIIQNFVPLLKTLGLLYVLFIVLQLAGYFSVFWMKKGEKVAVSNSKMIINNILGIVFALAFFNDQIATIVILSLIPWSTMIIAKHFYKRFLP